MSASVVARLEAATARAHVLLYGARRQRIGTFVEFVLLEGPRAVRRSAAFVWVATALFVVALLVSLVGTRAVDGFAPSVLPPQLLGQMERAYAEGFSGRTAGESSAMTGLCFVYCASPTCESTAAASNSEILWRSRAAARRRACSSCRSTAGRS